MGAVENEACPIHPEVRFKQSEEAWAELVEQLASSPFFPRIHNLTWRRSVMDVLTARHGAAMFLLATRDPRSGVVGGEELEELDEVAMAAKLVEVPPYLVKVKCMDLIEEHPLPAHVVGREQMPHDQIFICFEKGMNAQEDGGMGEPTDWTAVKERMNWIYVVNTPTGMLMLMDFSRYENDGDPYATRMKIHATEIDYGGRYPDDFPEEPYSVRAYLLRLLAFINSPYTEVEGHRLSRQQRRAWGRRGVPKENLETEVSMITLRKKVPSVADRAAGAGESREWGCQWWVRGHYRAQWYPSQEAHKVIWIAPYLKGPQDKPVRQRVYAVSR